MVGTLKVVPAPGNAPRPLANHKCVSKRDKAKKTQFAMPLPASLYPTCWFIVMGAQVAMVAYIIAVLQYYQESHTAMTQDTKNTAITQMVGARHQSYPSVLFIVMLMLVAISHGFLLAESLGGTLANFRFAFQVRLQMLTTESEIANTPNHNFDFWFHLQESLEVVFVVFQSFRVTKSIAAPSWMPVFSVALAVSKACITVILPWLLRNHKPLVQRAVRLIKCIVFNVVSFMLLPWMVLVAFENELHQVTEDQSRLNPLHRARAFSQIELVVSYNLFTAVCIGFQGMSAVVCCIQVRRILSSCIPIVAATAKENSSVRSDRSRSSRTESGRHVQRASLVCIWFSCVDILYQVLALGMGAAVLAIHLLADRNATTAVTSAGCYYHTETWFISTHACFVMEIDCHKRGITGISDELDLLLKNLHSTSLTALVIRNCGHLEIPPSLVQFHSLASLDIYSSTIASWLVEAAITVQNNPELHVLRFIDVNMSGQLPSGLWAADRPSPLTLVQMTHTDLTSLPNNLSSRWPAEMESLVIEQSLLTEIPEVLTTMSIQTISLAGNNIALLSPAFFANATRPIVSLAHNSLTALPDELLTCNFTRLSVADTKLSILPDGLLTTESFWFNATGDSIRTMNAANTPLCANLHPETMAGERFRNETLCIDDLVMFRTFFFDFESFLTLLPIDKRP